jgi:CheY-like chemotaxis protein
MSDARDDHTTRIDFPVPASEKAAPFSILVADDDEIGRAIVVNVLKGMGYRPEVAENGHEAVHSWERGDFDLILMDIHMPLIDGIEATWIIRSQESDRGDYTPIIAYSADYVTEHFDKLFSLGFDGFVRKPVALELLLREIERCIQLKQTRPV